MKKRHQKFRATVPLILFGCNIGGGGGGGTVSAKLYTEIYFEAVNTGLLRKIMKLHTTFLSSGSCI